MLQIVEENTDLISEGENREYFDPKEEYEIPDFEIMLGYAQSFIRKIYPDSSIEIKNSDQRNQLHLYIDDKVYNLTQTQLQIFCFLCRYEGETIKPEDISKCLKSSSGKLMTTNNIKVQISKWNSNIPEVLGIKTSQATRRYVGEVKLNTLTSRGSISLLEDGKNTSIYKGFNHILSVELTPSEKGHLLKLINNTTIPFPQDPREKMSLNVGISKLRSKLEGQSVLSIETKRKECYELKIHSIEGSIQETQEGAYDALNQD